MPNRVPLVWLSAIVLCLASLIGCAEVNVSDHGDTETGSDTDADSDTDVDTDTDADTDTDVDSDTDTDTDTDGDTDPVTCEDEGDCGGDPCVDGYCCDGPCTGTCQACNIPGSEGTCTAYAAGGDPEEECAAAEPATCGLSGSCDGASACAYFGIETACDDEQVCTEDDACDGAGGCAGVAAASCDPGPTDECCVGSCSDALGCYTEVEGCENTCTGTSLTVGQTCVGCGPANAEGVCTGGTATQCTASSHTQCAEQPCGGVTYYCTNDGGTWAWRTAIPCDDGNACTYDDSCFGGDCLATTYSCVSDACMDRQCDGEGDCDETPIPDVDCGTTACPADTCTGGDWQDYGASCTNTCSDLGECETCSCSATPTDCTVGAGNECCATACSPSGGCYTASGSCGGTDTCSDVNTKIVGSVCTGCGTNGAAGTCEGGGTFPCSAGSHTACQNVSCGGTTYYCTNVGSVWQWRTTPGCDDLDSCSYGDACGSGGCEGIDITCADTACLLSDCDGTSACDETPLSSAATCGTTTCPADNCGAGVWYNYPVSCTSYCSGDGACNTCSCTASSSTCAAGLSNVCCTASCDAVGGCTTAAGSCAAADACGDPNTLYYAKTCTGCGLNGANGACGGGSTGVCNSTTHTLCQRVTCGGTVYRCTNVLGVWQWRPGMGCDDSNLCSYNDVCNGSDVCDGTDITCTSSLCVDRACNGTVSCAVSYPDGSACDDGNLCTYNTTCNGAGSCTGTTVTCTDLTCMDYYCDGDSTCGQTPINIGYTCDDGDPVTINDTCQSSGLCVGVDGCTLSVLEQFTTSPLPTGWSVDDFDADAYDWVWSSASNTTGGTGGYWWVDGHYSASYDDRLVSALYQRGTCPTVTLSYRHDYNYNVGDFAYVQISVDGGTWQTVTTYSADATGLVNTNITSYLSANSNFRIRFRYVANTDWYWKIDDFGATGS